MLVKSESTNDYFVGRVSSYLGLDFLISYLAGDIVPRSSTRRPFRRVRRDKNGNHSVKNIDSHHHNVEDLFTVIGASEESIEKLSTAPYSYWRETFKQLIKKPLAILSVIVILLIVFFTIFGPMMKSYRVVSNSEGLADIFTPNQSWSADHWFGTGGNKMNFYKGLDLWTVVWVGARLSLILGTVVASIALSSASSVGSLWVISAASIQSCRNSQLRY